MSLPPPTAVMQDPGLSPNTKRWISELYKFITPGLSWKHLETLDISTGTSVTTSETFPATVIKIAILFDNLDTDGSNDILIQIGTSGGLVVTGYTGADTKISAGPAFNTNNQTTGFGVRRSAGSDTYVGRAEISKFSKTSDVWVYTSLFTDTNAGIAAIASGEVDLAGTLTQLKILPSGGDNLGGGEAQIWYYG